LRFLEIINYFLRSEYQFHRLLVMPLRQIYCALCRYTLL